jgi:hypothetical protein
MVAWHGRLPGAGVRRGREKGVACAVGEGARTGRSVAGMGGDAPIARCECQWRSTPVGLSAVQAQGYNVRWRETPVAEHWR